MAARTDGDRHPTRTGRRHELLPHTADAGLHVVAPSLAALFEEAAVALSTFSADVPTHARASTWEDVYLEASDLAGLAYGWLNELVALGDVHHGAVVEATVDRVDRVGRVGRAGSEGPDAGSAPDRAWRLVGRVGLEPFSAAGIRPRRQVKSATYHQLDVGRRGRRWTLQAYLDV